MKWSYQASIFFTLIVVLCIPTKRAYCQGDDYNMANSRFYFSGTLENNQQIEFNFQIQGFEIFGSCILPNVGAQYVLKGRFSADKVGIGLLVYNDKNEFIASIEAKVKSDEFNYLKEINGVWKLADGKLIKTLHLTKVAELAFLVNDIEQYYSYYSPNL